ncbi:hypothetical protein K9N68_39880 (plasmid) [Kovacikia minuta CCNUW1]|uniref:hypothetical protein n=1 Tax=Kovacikia minuta TaxID=2931930 RepID=UPI001CCAB88F|nr:hypothetical protein [Kovacikia minuta]UBF30758.1 hypothetical protein K9N68_39880 [Kovacikia minuta CCNUW1]
MPIQGEQEELMPEEPPDLEQLELEQQREAEQRQEWRVGIARIAHLGIQVAGQPHPENGNRVAQTLLDDEHIYDLEWRPRDQTLIVRATDGRGDLMTQCGNKVELKDTFTETDWYYLQRQEQYFLKLQAIEAKLQRESWGREMAAVIKLAQKIAGKMESDGPRYRITYDGQTLTLAAKDGRGVLMRIQGDQIQVSEPLTKADYDHFQEQLPALRALQEQQNSAKTPPNSGQSRNGPGGLGGIGG